MAKIKEAWREQSIGRSTQGENFQKGDYIPTTNEYWAKTSSGSIIKLSAELIRSVLGCLRITDNRLSDLVGKDSDIFVQK